MGVDVHVFLSGRSMRKIIRLVMPRAFGILARILSLVGRLAFILAASAYLRPAEFGIYGLIASATFLISQLVGLEAYQVVLREVAQVELGSDSSQRQYYGAFVVMSSVMATVLGILGGLYFEWSMPIVLFCGIIMGLEYAGLETSRMLIAEGKATAAMSGIAIRYLPWSLGLPLSTVLGLHDSKWSIIEVLAAWAVCSAVSLTLGSRIYSRYSPELLDWRGFLKWYLSIVRGSALWLTVALAWRILENGNRFLSAFFMTQASVGKFVLYSTIASFGVTGLKSVIEPFWFVKLLNDNDDGHASMAFTRIVLGWTLISSLASVIVYAILLIFRHPAVDRSDVPLLLCLVLAYAGLGFSQIYHFRAYSAHRDARIFKSSAISLGVSIACISIFSLLFGPIGAAGGTLLGSAALLILKRRAAYSKNI